MFSFVPKWLIGLGLLVWVADLQARSFHRIGNANGVDARVVSALLVDREGFLWISSREGLYRYDGYTARSFRWDPDDPRSLSDNDIRYVHEARDGVIWVSTNSGGLNRYDRVADAFERFGHDPEDPSTINDNNVYSIAEDGENRIWIATEKGVARMDADSGGFTRHRHDPRDDSSLSSDRAYALYQAPQGALWIATVGGGVNRWDPETGRFTRFDLARLADGPATLNDTFAIRSSADGRLWVGTRAGLVEMHPETATARRIGLTADPAESVVVPGLDFDAEGRLWIASMDHGVFILDPETSAVEPAHPGAPGDDGNVPAQPLVTLEISGENVFVGTWGSGVYLTQATQPPFELLGGEREPGLLPNNTISAVMATGRPGHPWLGSFGGGVMQVDVAARALEHDLEADDPMFAAGVLDIVRFGDGPHLAATSRGLFTFGEDARTLEIEQHDPAAPGGLGPGYLFALLAAENGDLWVGAGGSGLYRRRPESASFERYAHEPAEADSLGGDFVTTLLEGDNDMLWVGTRSNGLNRCRIDPWRCERFEGRSGDAPGLGHYHVTDLFRSRRGRLWIATDGGGLNEVVQDENGEVLSFRHWGTADGLLSDGIMAIEEDLDESLWLSSRHGLTRLDPDTGDVVNHVAASGLQVSHFNAGAADADSDYIYFGSVAGLLVIRKGSTLHTREPSPVRTTLIQTAERGAQLKSYPWTGEPISLPYGRVLSVEFAVLDFSESRHEYAYRLNTGEPWTARGTRREVTFFGLAPGRYQIQARGRDAFGLWNESESIDLRVLPPFWMQPWFRLLVTALLIMAAVGLHRVRLARQRRIAREVQRLSERREAALESVLGTDAELAVLTPRQKEVLQLIAEGYSTHEISDLLGVSFKTVHAHRANLMERLDIHDVPGLVRLAVRTRLVSPQD